jgi:signal transduction histidine kinase
MLNLLSNAVKFTSRGRIALYVGTKINRDGSERLFIKITDTGIGMSADVMEKIFDKYIQADSSIKRKYGGTGLGLYISRDLAHLMHGEITVKSWPGRGSHFFVTLPLKEAVPMGHEMPRFQEMVEVG